MPCLAGGVVAGDLGVEEAAADEGLLGLELVGDEPLVLLLRDLLNLRRSLGGHLSS